jgi:hypothetical protein
LAIAFKITSCSFIIRTSAATEIFSGAFNPPESRRYIDRTNDKLIGPDK